MCAHDRLCTAVTAITSSTGELKKIVVLLLGSIAMTHWSRCFQRWLFLKVVLFVLVFGHVVSATFQLCNPRMTPGQKMLLHMTYSMSLWLWVCFFIIYYSVWLRKGRALENTGHFGHETQVTCFIVPFFFATSDLFPRCAKMWKPSPLRPFPRLGARFHDFARNVMLTVQLPGLAHREKHHESRCVVLPRIPRLVHALYGHGTNASSHIAHLIWERLTRMTRMTSRDCKVSEKKTRKR